MAELASCTESVAFSSAIQEPELQRLQLWLVLVQLWDQKHLTDGIGPTGREGIALSPAALRTGDAYLLLSPPLGLVRQNYASHVVLPTWTTIYGRHRVSSTQSSSYLQKGALEKPS